MATARETWITEGLRALGEGGPSAVRIEPIAKALGVTKGGFYWHFADRGALLDEMLDTWERVMVDDVIAFLESEERDDRAKLTRLFALAGSRPELMRAELAVRDWSRRDPEIAARLQRVDDRRMDYMRSRFAGFCADADEVEARCLLTLALFVGNDFIAAGHGSRTRADVIGSALRRLLA
jgi:AcrR family transcriptional regulator